MIFNIGKELLDIVYFKMDREDKRSLGTTCRSFYWFQQENERFSKLVNLILENHEVLTNMRGYPLEILLKRARVILVGENHIKDSDRTLLAQVAVVVWEIGRWILLTEGKYSSGVGPIKYVPEYITKTHQSWDHWIKKDAAPIIEYWQDKFLYFTSKFLTARDEQDKHQQFFLCKGVVEELSVFIVIDQNTYQLLDLNLQNMAENLSKNKNPVKRSRFEVVSLFAMVGRMISITLWQHCHMQIDQCIRAIRSVRDNHLVTTTVAETNHGNNALVNAGNEHVNDGPEKPIRTLNSLGIPFVSIVGKHFLDSTVAKYTSYTREEIKAYNTLPASLFVETSVRLKYYVDASQIVRNEWVVCNQEANRILNDVVMQLQAFKKQKV